MAEPLARSAHLTGFGELAGSFGLDPLVLVAEQGLPAACLTEPDLRIPAAPLARLLERTATLAGVADFGLRLAETRRLSNIGAVAFVIRDQPNVRKALDVFMNYSWTHNEAIALRLDVLDEIAVIHGAMTTTPLYPQGAQLMFGMLTMTLRRLIGRNWRPVEVWLRQPPLPDAAIVRRVFGGTPRFGQEIDALVLDAGDLSLEIIDADPVAAERALRYLERDLGSRRADAAATVRTLIYALLPTGTCCIERVAAHMGVSRRTLHRRLAADGLTFMALVHEIRADLARRHIETGGLPLTEIAERLGYGSLSAFSRWRTHRAAGGQ